MGRAQGGVQITLQEKRKQLTERQEKILDFLKTEGMAPASWMKRFGAPQTLRKELELLEKMGEVVRVYNPNGPQTPWWWQKAKRVPASFTPPDLSKGQIWDWGSPDQGLWLEVQGTYNEYGLPVVTVKAGQHNPVKTVIPLHYFEIFYPRRRAEATSFSAQFSCPIHGECGLYDKN